MTNTGLSARSELRDWCHHAEATDIGALSDFVAELKSYTMPTRAAT